MPRQYDQQGPTEDFLPAGDAKGLAVEALRRAGEVQRQVDGFNYRIDAVDTIVGELKVAVAVLQEQHKSSEKLSDKAERILNQLEASDNAHKGGMLATVSLRDWLTFAVTVLALVVAFVHK